MPVTPNKSKATLAHEINADLHAHSNVSDGTLPVADLVHRAADAGVELFALTDHDELSGLAEARAAAAERGLHFLCGVEISVTWAGRTIHIVGLGIDPNHAGLAAGLESVRGGRLQRAKEMGEGLARAGIFNAFEGALKHVANPNLISRTHFARELVERGVCADTREVFRRYLTEGKPGFVPHRWAALADAVGWIHAAGGVAVVAHPARYALSDTELWCLLLEFRERGGEAIEVATSNHTAADVERFANMALEFGFEGSRGSDFHGPGESQAELGRAQPLPYRVPPVWQRFV
jgi:3',5'-nucleoside bisphosphate phosphatase